MQFQSSRHSWQKNINNKKTQVIAKRYTWSTDKLRSLSWWQGSAQVIFSRKKSLHATFSALYFPVYELSRDIKEHLKFLWKIYLVNANKSADSCHMLTLPKCSSKIFFTQYQLRLFRNQKKINNKILNLNFVYTIAIGPVQYSLSILPKQIRKPLTIWCCHGGKKRNVSLKCINLFLTNVPLLYPLKTLENFWFSDAFRGYKSGTLVEID